MNSRIEKLPFFGTFFKPEQKQKAISQSPYPAFFRKFVQPPRVTEPGKIHKAVILQKGIQGKAVRLFVTAVWGGKVVKGLQEVARERKGVDSDLTQRLIDGSDKREGRLGAVEYRSDKGLPQLPKGHLDDMRAEARNPLKASSIEIAQAHLQALRQTNNCPAIKSGDGNPWRALRVSTDEDGETLKVTESTVCPTSERALEVSNDLTNIYYHVSDDGHLSITCGVIDTELKANQFMAAVAEALIYRDGMRPTQTFPDLRISMHQLNSMGSGPGVVVSERSLVNRQHQMVDYINQHMQSFLQQYTKDKLKGHVVTFTGNPPYVAHVNRCLNGFTQIKGENANAYPNNREGIAIQMGWLAKDIGHAILPAEYLSKQRAVNKTIKDLQAKKAQLAMAMEAHIMLHKVNNDLKEVEAKIINLQIKMLDLPEGEHAELEQLRNTFDSMKSLKRSLIEQIAENERELEQKKAATSNQESIQQSDAQKTASEQKSIKQIKKEIKVLDTQLKGQMMELTVAMNAYEKELAKHPEQKELHTKLKIATHILAVQTEMTEKLGLPQLTPTQELAYQLLFDQMLNIVTEINCKSGLDRTGFARSLLNAIQQEIKKGHTLAEIASFFDNFESGVQAMDRDIEEKMRQDPNFNFTEWLENEGWRHRGVYDFQASVFAELVGVARRITGRSAGVEGLKWHHDKKSINPFEKNPHPVPFIPMFIVADDKTVPLIQVNRNGHRSFTKDGNAVLMGLSARRGG